jgi:TRAP-type C4-dicarboxylate transport system permease small subunit
LQFGFDLASLGFAVLLFWQLLGLATRSQAREITAATTLRTPLWWPQAMMAAGVLLLVLALIVQLWRGARRLRAPEQVREHGAA